jgi:hypothetical protein
MIIIIIIIIIEHDILQFWVSFNLRGSLGGERG